MEFDCQTRAASVSTATNLIDDTKDVTSPAVDRNVRSYSGDIANRKERAMQYSKRRRYALPIGLIA